MKHRKHKQPGVVYLSDDWIGRKVCVMDEVDYRRLMAEVRETKTMLANIKRLTRRF